MADGRPRDVQDVEAEANEVTDQSLDATRRMKEMALETRDVGAKTLENLDSQGEQLRRTEQKMDHINTDLKASEKSIRRMEMCCGCIGCYCCKAKNQDKTEANKAAFGKNAPQGGAGGSDVVDEQPAGLSGRGGGAGKSGAGGQYVQHITDDAREDEMDENLGMVSSILGDLKAQAATMGNEIDEQNDMIDRIQAKGESNDQRINAANNRTGVLLKNA